jgi:hypothetical protein
VAASRKTGMKVPDAWRMLNKERNGEADGEIETIEAKPAARPG